MKIRFYKNAIRQPDIEVSKRTWKALSSRNDEVYARALTEIEVLTGFHDEDLKAIGISHGDDGYVWTGGVYDDLKVKALEKELQS